MDGPPDAGPESAPTEAAGVSPMPKRRAAFAFIFITLVLDNLAMGLTVPVLPKLVEIFQHGNIGGASQIVGLFGTVWALMQFFCAPILGALSDRFGRRPVVLISLLGMGLDYVLMALAPSLSWLFLGRILSGITASNGPAAFAYVADITPTERRAGAFGLLGAAWALGFIMGPAVGGLLGQIDLRLPFWAAAGLSLANWLYGMFVLPESLKPENRAAFSWARANPVGSMELLRLHPRLLGLGGVYFLYVLAHTSLPTVFVLYADFRYHWTPRDIGLAMTVLGVCGALVQALLIKPIVKHLGERGGLIIGLSLAAAGYVTYAAASQGWMFWLVVPLMALSGLANPSLQGLMSRAVDVDGQGRLQGANGSIAGLAGIIGPSLFGYMFAAFVQPSGPQIPGMPYYVSGFLVLIALVATLKFTAGRAGNQRF